jgi:hypothetical protein
VTASIFHNEPFSVKKMLQGDANWSTCKTILGWIIDTVAMTIPLPPRRLQRLADILAEIPLSQKRTSVKRRHQILGELRSMALAIPGARGLFSHTQDALCHKKDPKGRLILRSGVHDALHTTSACSMMIWPIDLLRDFMNWSPWLPRSSVVMTPPAKMPVESGCCPPLRPRLACARYTM